MNERKIHTEECIAKIILEECFGDMYENIFHSDKPDLESDARNVEVTTICEHCDIFGHRIKYPRRYIKREAENGVSITKPINDSHSVGEFIAEAVNHKLYKQYGTQKPIDLFIYCMDNYLIRDFTDEEYLQMISDMRDLVNEGSYSFEYIYIQTMSADDNKLAYNVIAIDLAAGTFKRFPYDMDHILKIFVEKYFDNHNGYSQEL